MGEWWKNPKIVENLPDDVQEAIREAAEQGRTFDENDTDPGATGTSTSN